MYIMPKKKKEKNKIENKQGLLIFSVKHFRIT